MRGLPYSGNMSLTSSYFMFLSSIFLLLTFQLSYSLSSMHPLCHADERSALLQFKESFIINNSTCRFFYDDYLPPVASWTLENSSCCSWVGVDCDKKSGHVIGLELINSCLYGSINSSSSLFQLVHLQLLDLSYNNFNFSQIPSSIGNLSKLQYLRLFDSFFAGQIPSEISQLSKLSSLDLSCNSQPSSCSVLGLVSFDPSSKRLLELKRPHFESLVQNLTNLEELSLSLVNIPYPVPSLLANMSSLSFLILTSCGLLGELPTNIFQLPNAEFLHLVQNPGLIGNLPDFNRTSHLNYLNVMGTGMSGEIPASIGNLGSLEQLSLSFNNFSGLVPPSIGEIPPLICNQTLLQVLDLSKNNLSGQIPECLGSLSNSLSILNLGSNNFHGTIPQTWTLGCKLRMINLGQNKLKGLIPRSMSKCAMLEFFDLGHNQINDTFPFWLGTLPELKILILQYNKFHGAIESPYFKSTFPKLRIIDLSYNGLVGNLPSDYFNSCSSMKIVDEEQLAYLQADISFDMGLNEKLPDFLSFPMMVREYYDYSIIVKNKGLRTEYAKIIAVFALLDFSGNKFEGEVPESIGTLKGLIALDLSNNLLSGHIPSAMGNLTQLESLDLSLNKLSGEIPQQLAQLNFLSFFNVSYNNFTGPILRGNQFDTFLNNSFEGNSGLCGNQLSRKCEGPKAFLPPLSASTDNQESGSSIEYDWKIVVIGYGSGFIIGVVIGHIVITRKHDLFLKNFGIRQPKASKGKKK
ncbi:hypothetical protein ACB092_12G183100 [Castanea dentata]